MTDYEYLEKLLDEKLNSFLTLLKLELGNVKREVAEIADELTTHQNSNEELERTMHESLVRVHSRIDSLEEKIEVLQKPDLAKIALVKLIEWAVPIGMLFVFWLLTNGSLFNFLASVAGQKVVGP